jgi:hypothetical protein
VAAYNSCFPALVSDTCCSITDVKKLYCSCPYSFRKLLKSPTFKQKMLDPTSLKLIL